MPLLTFQILCKGVLRMDKKLEISQEYLEQALNTTASSLVGQVMKRFEILSDKEDIKSETKELIYEKFRELKSVLRAFSSGVKFVTPKKRA